MKVDEFKGPISSLELAQWLSSCEIFFEDDSGEDLQDKAKIHAAGNAISNSGPTKALHDWFIQNRKKLEGKTWVEFREAIKDKALGKGWRVRALQDFYTTTHHGKTLEEYFTALDDKKFVVDRSDPWVPPLDDLVYKCYLLFHAPPSHIAQILKSEVFYDDKNFMAVDSEDVKEWLRRYDNGAITGFPQAQFATSGMYILSGLASRPSTLSGARQWSDLQDLPEKSSTVGHLASLTVRWGYRNNNNDHTVLAGYEFQFTGMTVKPSLALANPIASQTLSLDLGEYITSIKASYTEILYHTSNGVNLGISTVLTGLEILTSNASKTLSLGSVSATPSVFTAPSGSRIVGFYGSNTDNYHSDRAYNAPCVIRLGVILLPL